MSSPPPNTDLCHVCGARLERSHLHFGAYACNSCRAFFRRIHKVSKESPSLHCKSNGTCEVSVRTRSRCQNCRYSKCVQAGMKPEYVLNEEERKHRFKKDPASSGASEVNDRFSLDEEAPQLCGDKRSCSSSVKRFSGGAQCQHQGVSGIASSSFQPKIWSFHHGIVVEDDSARTVWKECYKEHTIETAFLKDLIKFHRGDSDLLYHPLLWRHLLKLGTLFERYAARDQALGLISSRDRKKLLHFNKLLFIQFILSQYVSAPTGVSQIEWLLLAQVPDFSCTEEEKRQLKRKPIKDLKLIFFEDRYKAMCNAALTAMSPAPPLCCLPELLDLLILYAPPSLSCDHSSFLQKKLDLTLDQMTTRSRSCFQITRVGDLFLHLGQLSLFYSQNVSWDWSDLAQIGSDAITCYEDKASARQYKEMHEAQRTVNLGEDILRDTIMINFDLATMPSLFLSAIKVIMEKCQHMLDAHEVVKRLPSTAMHQQFKINSLVQLVTTWIARMDNLPTWEAQIEFARGHDDQDTLGKFNLLAGSRDCPITLIRPLTLSKMSSFNENDPPIFKADKLEQVVAGFGELKILAGPEDDYRHVLLATMFDVEVTDVVPELKNERKTNLELLDKRDARQMWEGEAKLRPCLGKIKQLTENVRLLMDAATLVRREEAEREGEGGGVEFTGNNS